MATGAAIGLALAGYSLFTARGTTTLFVPPEAVALVNQQIISRVDFTAQLQALYATDLEHASREQRARVLNDMIREELMVQRGKELDVASSDPDVRSAMVNAVEMQIAADAMTSIPSEAELRTYYEKHLQDFSSEGVMSVEDYVFPLRSDAASSDAVRALRSEAADPSATAGLETHRSAKVGPDEFYFAAKIHLGDRLFAIARNLAGGEVSDPVVIDGSIHVLRMIQNQTPRPVSFDAARSRVLTNLRKESVDRATRSDEKFLVRRANILIADDMR